MVTKKSKSDNQSETGSPKPTQIFDVARPGTLPPANATSRPVIVTNRTVMEDPMMVPKSGLGIISNPTDESVEIRSVPKVVISPLSDEDSTTDEAVGQTTQKDSDSDGLVDTDKPQPAAEDTSAPESAQPTDSSGAKQSDSQSDNSHETDDNNGNAESPQTKADKEAAQLEAEAKAQDELDTIVDQKTYFLPIKTVEQRRNRNVFVFGMILILVLAAAWLDIALDAGLVHINGVRSLTHFFTN